MGKINNSNKRKFIIIGGIIFFFGIIFIFNLINLGVFNQDSQKPSVLNNYVVFDQPKLKIFDETRYINQYPDTLHIHFPNFIVVVPEDSNQITTVYSFTKKQKIASFNDIVLDYYNGSFLYNYHGGNTYLEGKNLKYHCDQGFIKSDTEILCVTQNETNPLYSDLISINPQNLVSKSIDSPQDAITAVYYNNSTLYLGEYDYNKKQAYLTINSIKIKTNDFINIIYPMNNNFYIASFKSNRNNISAAYYETIDSNNKILLKLADSGKIVLYN
jgi:hypothetical protein